MAVASIVITTRNRASDLRRSLGSALAQSVASEIIVLDDASNDGTASMVRREFPTVRLHRDEQARGLIVQRNRGAKLASNPFIFSIDDDAVFSTPNVIEQTLRDFDHPRVGAVAIPFADVNRSPEVHQRAPEPSGVYATYSYIGTAHALRRELFLGLSGYREILFHQGEEEDYSIRLLEAGHITRLGNADPIHHFESPRRSWARMDYYGARNKVLYAWHNVPFPSLAVHLPIATFKASLFSLRPRRFWTRLRGVLSAYHLTFAGVAARSPVRPWVYHLSRELKRRGAVPIEEIESSLGGRTMNRGTSQELETRASAKA
jgi:glycosyltransferase involved in cell wall biosynthesis